MKWNVAESPPQLTVLLILILLVGSLLMFGVAWKHRGRKMRWLYLLVAVTLAHNGKCGIQKKFF